MKALWFISAFMLCYFLLAENNDVELIRYNSIDIPLMDTSELEPKLKHFLNKFYQKICIVFWTIFTFEVVTEYTVFPDVRIVIASPLVPPEETPLVKPATGWMLRVIL